MNMFHNLFYSVAPCGEYTLLLIDLYGYYNLQSYL